MRWCCSSGCVAPFSGRALGHRPADNQHSQQQQQPLLSCRHHPLHVASRFPSVDVLTVSVFFGFFFFWLLLIFSFPNWILIFFFVVELFETKQERNSWDTGQREEDNKLRIEMSIMKWTGPFDRPYSTNTGTAALSTWHSPDEGIIKATMIWTTVSNDPFLPPVFNDFKTIGPSFFFNEFFLKSKKLGDVWRKNK